MEVRQIVIDSSVFIKFEERMTDLISLFTGIGGLTTSFPVHEIVVKERFSSRIDFEVMEERIVVDGDQDSETIYDLRNNELQDLGLTVLDCSVLELARRTQAKLLTCNRLLRTAAKRMQIELAELPDCELDAPANKAAPMVSRTCENAFQTRKTTDYAPKPSWVTTVVGSNNMYNSKTASTMT